MLSGAKPPRSRICHMEREKRVNGSVRIKKIGRLRAGFCHPERVFLALHKKVTK
jgi:hypothetical protein